MRRDAGTAGRTDRLLEEAASAFEDGEPARALELSESACAADPRSISALHYRAAALAELGRLDEACEAYQAALARGPDDVDLLFDAADFFVNRAQPPEADREWLERGLALARRGSQLARKLREDDLGPELGLVEAVALNQLGLPKEALARLDAVLAALPRDVDALLERAFSLYELCRFDAAAAQLEEVVRIEPDQAWAHHYLGLLAERRGDAREAERCFARARRASPQDFPKPVSLSPEAFDAAVEDALASLPEAVRQYLGNVAIAVEDLPADDDLLASDPPLSPSILGVFRGSPYGQKGSMDPWSHFPSSIVLYQKNLERFARDKKELVEQIGITLIHEVGHFLGLDEEDLWERGLE
jgi:predicted Zn-dependent protease with MMP-like domain/Tfp pilus assembly protein PilF